MNAEQVLRDYIGALVMQIAVLQGEVNRLKTLVPKPRLKAEAK